MKYIIYYIFLTSFYLYRQEISHLELKVKNLMEKLDETHKYETGRKKHHVTESGKDDSEL